MNKLTQNTVPIVLLRWLCMVSAALLVTTAKAEIYKCMDAEGKTAFSDQPCVASQQSSTFQPKVVSGESGGMAGSSKSPAGLDYKSRPEYPECLKLKSKIDDYFMGPVVGTTGKQAEQARDDLARYKEICMAVDQAAGRELVAKRDVPETRKREVDRTAENAARCEAMQRNLAELEKLGPALAKSTDRLNPQEASERKKQIAGIEQRIPLIAREIEKDCRKK